MSTPLHRRVTHVDEVPGCFGCHLATLHVAHSSEWAGDKRREKTLDRDLDAYARLRAEGLQPEGVDGAARLEQTAQDHLDVNMASSPFIKRMDIEQRGQFVQAIEQAA